MAIVLLSNQIRSKFSVTVLRTLNRHETILFYQVNPLKLVTGMAIKHSSDTVNPTYALYSTHTTYRYIQSHQNDIYFVYTLDLCRASNYQQLERFANKITTQASSVDGSNDYFACQRNFVSCAYTQTHHHHSNDSSEIYHIYLFFVVFLVFALCIFCCDAVAQTRPCALC